MQPPPSPRSLVSREERQYQRHSWLELVKVETVSSVKGFRCEAGQGFSVAQPKDNVAGYTLLKKSLLWRLGHLFSWKDYQLNKMVLDFREHLGMWWTQGTILHYYTSGQQYHLPFSSNSRHKEKCNYSEPSLTSLGGSAIAVCIAIAGANDVSITSDSTKGGYKVVTATEKSPLLKVLF